MCSITYHFRNASCFPGETAMEKKSLINRREFLAGSTAAAVGTHLTARKAWPARSDSQPPFVTGVPGKKLVGCYMYSLDDILNPKYMDALQKKLGVLRIAGAALVSSSVFFIVTNFAVWAFSPMYAKTFEGLVLCYTMAIPFFQNTIAGDLIWSGTIFGSYLALRNYSNLQIFNQKDSLIFN